MFHTVVGHYLGCGWSVEQILQHLRQFPDGIGGRYLSEGRLSREIARSASKYTAGALPLFDGWATAFEAKVDRRRSRRRSSQDRLSRRIRTTIRSSTMISTSRGAAAGSEAAAACIAHGDPDPRPLKSWLIKRLMPAVGHGLLAASGAPARPSSCLISRRALGTGQPFLGHVVKRQMRRAADRGRRRRRGAAAA